LHKIKPPSIAAIAAVKLANACHHAKDECGNPSENRRAVFERLVVLSFSLEPMHLTLTASVNGTTVEAAVRSEVVLELRENPSTGYLWDVETDDGLQIVSSVFTQDPAPPDYIGVPGWHRFGLVAAAPGAFEVRGKLWQEFAGESSVTERCVFTIHATQAAPATS
jgi:predicted secreted protein